MRVAVRVTGARPMRRLTDRRGRGRIDGDAAFIVGERSQRTWRCVRRASSMCETTGVWSERFLCVGTAADVRLRRLQRHRERREVRNTSTLALMIVGAEVPPRTHHRIEDGNSGGGGARGRVEAP